MQLAQSDLIGMLYFISGYVSFIDVRLHGIVDKLLVFLVWGWKKLIH